MIKFFDINTAVGHWPFQQLEYESPELLAGHLEKYHIAGALVVNTHGLFYRNVQNANIELAKWIADKPFFTGCASINPAYPQWEKDLKRCVDEFGFRAVRMTPLYHGYGVDSQETDALLGVAGKLGIPVLIPQRIMDLRQRHHLDVNAIVVPEDVFTLAERHPECRIICTETVIVDNDLPRIAPLKNLYIETSRQISGFSGLFNRIVDAVGAERVLFGSGTPFKEVLPSILKVVDSRLSEDSIQKIAFKNSINLLERK